MYPYTKNNGVGQCRWGTLDVGLFILDYKSVIFSGVRRVQDFCFSCLVSCLVNGHQLYETAKWRANDIPSCTSKRYTVQTYFVSIYIASPIFYPV